MKFKVWLDSGANAHSCYEQEVSLEDMGVTREQWDEWSEEYKDDYMRDFAWNRMEWGYAEIE